jgi:Ca2+-binding RTX toxin-like protein
MGFESIQGPNGADATVLGQDGGDGGDARLEREDLGALPWNADVYHSINAVGGRGGFTIDIIPEGPPIDGGDGGDAGSAFARMSNARFDVPAEIAADTRKDVAVIANGGYGTSGGRGRQGVGGDGGNGGDAFASFDGFDFHTSLTMKSLNLGSAAMGGSAGDGQSGQNSVTEPHSGAGGKGGSAYAELRGLDVSTGALTDSLRLDVIAVGSPGGSSQGAYDRNNSRVLPGDNLGGVGGDAIAILTDNIIVGNDATQKLVLNVHLAAGLGGGQRGADGQWERAASGSAAGEISDNQIALGGGDDRLEITLTRGSDTVIRDNIFDGGDGFDVLNLSAADAAGSVYAYEDPQTWFSMLENSVTGFEEVRGGASMDHIQGDHAANRLFGEAGDDVLQGEGGNDRLDGGAGNDRLEGGAGDDVYFVNSSADVVIEKAHEGTDIVFASADFSLVGGHVERLVLTGAGDIDATGNGLSNILFGNDGANVLDGKGGADVLKGGGGADMFLFSTRPGPGNVDRIADFSVADDIIGLSSAVFGLPVGVLRRSAFRVGTAAHDATDRIVYDPATGAIWYDADGSGAGAAVQFATVTAGLALTNADFVII